MNFSDLIKHRQSVRKYLDKPIEKEKLDQLIEAVRLAPSASNSQPWKLIIVDQPELKNEVAKATYNTLVRFNKFAPQAPVIAVFCLEEPKLITRIGASLQQTEYPLIDIGIAASHFCLQAEELGLGTCMIGWFDEEKVKQLLHIPEKTKVALLVTVGYPPEDYPLRSKQRKKREEMSSYNSY